MNDSSLLSPARRPRRRRLYASTLLLVGMAWTGPELRCDPSLSCGRSAGTAPTVEEEPWCAGDRCGAVSVSAGAEHTCALVGEVRTLSTGVLGTEEARVVCWGRNDEGQSDPAEVGSLTEGPTPVATPPLGPATSAERARLATGTLQGCASVDDPAVTQLVTCWGSNARGLLGGTDPHARTAVSQLGATTGSIGERELVAVHAGAAHTCGERGREAACAGDDEHGSITGRLDPPAYCVGPLGCSTGGLLSLAIGGRLTCGLRAFGGREVEGYDVECQGAPSFEGLDSLVPGPDARLSVGFAHGCGLDLSIGVEPSSDHRVVCWGDRTRGATGPSADAVQAIDLPHRVLAIGAGGALDVEVSSPTELSVGEPIGGGHSCALLVTGEVYCWGANDRGQLGDGTTDDRRYPVRVEDLPPAVALDLGGAHTCAVTEAAEVHCWGDNRWGQLGHPPSDSSTRPLRVPLLP